MRNNLLRFFGLLDILSIILTAGQIQALILNFDSIPKNILLIIAITRILLFFSLFLSAAGLLLRKGFGITTYYIQFIFRFLTLILSFGFITYINQFFNNTAFIVKLTLTLAVFGEFLRLYLTYRISKKNKFQML